MDNEELAVLVQRGSIDKLPQLWDQVSRFVRQKAYKWSRWKEAEFDDLMQSGYLALVDAASGYDPASGASFLSYFALHLKKHFNVCCANAAGWTRGTYQKAKEKGEVRSLNISLPSKEGDDSGAELLDTIADPVDAYDGILEQDYNDSLGRKLDELLSRLPESERLVLRLRYYQNLTQADARAALGLSRWQIQNLEKKALYELRKPHNRSELEGWIDSRTNYALRVGVRSFRLTGYSSVELIAERREKMRNRLLRGKAAAWD